MPDLQSETVAPAAADPTPQAAPDVIRTKGHPVDSFTREQRADRWGRRVRWYATDVGVAIEVIVTADGITVTGSARSVNREFARDLAAVLEVAAWAQQQLALGEDPLKLWPDALATPVP